MLRCRSGGLLLRNFCVCGGDARNPARTPTPPRFACESGLWAQRQRPDSHANGGAGGATRPHTKKAPRQRTPTGRRLYGGPAASMGERSTSCPAGFCCARGWQPSTCCQASSLRPHLGHKSSKKAPTAEAMGAVACLWAYRTIIARHRPNTAPMAPQQRASPRASPP